ncbi:hypothetical protein [uncultured Tenacibaculum sp.]|uniref:hypothetical protein n=1 Tax=uncultured Tenacibaculum sp. TaxID=174713 RepID=UPI00261C0186|nr:hypothetical protein [uncultured Tenacibaculum sp.]
MVNKLINLKGSITKTLLLESTSLWFSTEEFNDEISLKSIVNKNSNKYLNDHANVNYSSIIKIEMNEDSKKINIDYKGKEEESISFIFESIELAHEVGGFIASKTSLIKNIKPEGYLKKLFYNNNILWVLGIISITILGYSKFFNAGFPEKGKLFKILNFLHNSIGANGILIIGTIITSYFTIKILQRFSKKVNDIVYK